MSSVLDLDYAAALARVIEEVVAPAAAEVDRAGVYPRAAVDAAGGITAAEYAP